MKQLTIRMLSVLCALITTSYGGLTIASPEGDLVYVTQVRPYNVNGPAGGAVYIDVSASTLCSTTVFKIDLSFSGSKEVYAAALTALAAGRQVRIEAAGCNGWGTTIQSLYLTNQ